MPPIPRLKACEPALSRLEAEGMEGPGEKGCCPANELQVRRMWWSQQWNVVESAVENGWDGKVGGKWVECGGVSSGSGCTWDGRGGLCFNVQRGGSQVNRQALLYTFRHGLPAAFF